MTHTGIASRYADALADVVTAPGSPVPPQAAVAELHSFEAAIASSADLRNALISPAVANSRKKAVVARLVKALGISRITQNFLFVLIDRRRIDGLAEIGQILEQTIDQRLGFATAQVVAARQLTEAQQTALAAELQRLAGKKIRLRVAVDANLIGGAVARIGSTVYDGSVRGRLQSLERRLNAET